MTLHRPSNVDDPEVLAELVKMVEAVTERTQVIFPMHPRTRKQLSAFRLLDQLDGLPNLTMTDPLGYLEFLRLMELASVVITDSGGIQEETTFLRVPCLTLRENTERPVTVTSGTNELLPVDTSLVVRRVGEILDGREVNGCAPELWDGKAAMRIAECIGRILSVEDTPQEPAN